MTDLHLALMIAIASGVTILLRILPFLIFGGGRETPPFVTYLGEVLPFAIIGMLVVFCLKNVTFDEAADWIPQLIAVAVTAGLHAFKRNTLLSILGGTVCYMLLIQMVF